MLYSQCHLGNEITKKHGTKSVKLSSNNEYRLPLDSILPIIAVFICPFIATVLCIYPTKFLAHSLDLIDHPTTGTHKSHTKPTPYGGALAITLGISLSIFFLTPEIIKILDQVTNNNAPWLKSLKWIVSEFQAAHMVVSPFLFCSLLIVIIGLIDDWRGLTPFIRLIFQITVTILLVVSEPSFSLRIFETSIFNIFATVLWIVILTNAFNFLDNMDGLSAGLGAISMIFTGYIALLIGDFSIAFLSFTIFGSLCGFLIFNLPPASIFMGDAGSLGLGFAIGAITIKLTHLGEISSDPILQLSPLLVASIPFYDALTVSLLRLKLGRPPWLGDTNHISHRLVRIGLSKQNAVLTVYVLLFLLSLPPLLTIHPSGDIMWIGITPLLIGILSIVDFCMYRFVSQNE